MLYFEQHIMVLRDGHGIWKKCSKWKDGKMSNLRHTVRQRGLGSILGFKPKTTLSVSDEVIFRIHRVA